MVLHEKQLLRRVYVKKHNGGALLEFLPLFAGKAASFIGSLISKIDLSRIAKSLGGMAVGKIASYGVNKLLTKNEDKPINAVHGPIELTSGPVPQGLINDDILPMKNEIEYIDPINHEIHLPNITIKPKIKVEPVSNSNIDMHRYSYKGGKINNKKNGGNIDKLLNKKSKDILNGIVG